MKNLKAILVLSVLVIAAHARAGIVVDDSPEDPTPRPVDATAKPPANAGDKEEPLSDTLLFSNKDVLHGSFLGCDKAGLRWQNPLSKEPFLFQIAGLSEAKLDTRKPPANTTAPTHSVQLTNGDELPGVLVSLDEKSLLLDTWYAGKLSIPRNVVKGITPWKGGNAVLYEGPTSIQGWTVSKSEEEAEEDGPNHSRDKSWIFNDGAFMAVSGGSIRRDVKLPPRARIEFDLSIAGDGDGSCSVGIFCENASEPSSGYALDIENGSIQLLRTSHGNSAPMGDQPVQLLPQMMRSGSMHIDVRANKQTKSIWLFINGKMLKQWTDKAEFAGAGTSIMFAAEEESYEKVGNIKVSAWDGRLDDPHAAAAKPSKEDSIKMANGDRVTGKLKSIADGKAVLASAYADVTIPLERIEQIDMSSEGTVQPKKGVNDLRACFADSAGSVTVEIESWDAKQITVSSQDFGNAAFSPDAFQRLIFDPSRQTSPPVDSAAETSGAHANSANDGDGGDQ